MTIVAQTRPFVIGVDCHARTHTYAIIEASTKRRVACEQFPTTPAGISRALAWVGRRTDGDMSCLWAVEGNLADTAAAHAAVEESVVGKVLIDVSAGLVDNALEPRGGITRPRD